MGIKIRTSPEEVWYWYEKIEEWKESGRRQKAWCKANGLDYPRFWAMYMRIEHKRISDPEYYQKLVSLAKEYSESNITMTNFVAQHKLPPKVFVQTITHLSYLKLIEDIKEGRITIDDKPMKFVKVPTIQPPTLISHNRPVEEVLPKQNDLEIIISKGVRVIISPNIEPLKVIKIIELLKDL